MQKKHVPMRMCTGCNTMKNKKDLIRLVKIKGSDNNGNIILVDKTFKQPGRGAYLCKNIDCLKSVRKSKRLERIFSCKIQDNLYSDIQEVILKDE